MLLLIGIGGCLTLIISGSGARTGVTALLIISLSVGIGRRISCGSALVAGICGGLLVICLFLSSRFILLD